MGSLHRSAGSLAGFRGRGGMEETNGGKREEGSIIPLPPLAGSAIGAAGCRPGSAVRTIRAATVT